MNIRIKKPGNYLVAIILPKKDDIDVIWEEQPCAAGQVFEEWQIDTEFMNQDEYEEVAA